MRRAILVGISRDEKAGTTVISPADVDLKTQLELFRKHNSELVNEQFSRMELWFSDGPARQTRRFTTKAEVAKQKADAAKREADAKKAKEKADADAKKSAEAEIRKREALEKKHRDEYDAKIKGLREREANAVAVHGQLKH